MEFDFEDDAHWAGSYAPKPIDHVQPEMASNAERAVSAETADGNILKLGFEETHAAQAHDLGDAPGLPSEELFVSRRADLRTRGYRELEDAFRDGHSEVWKFFPWFREMLMDSDDAAFAAACAAVAEHYRGGHQVTPLTWLGVLAERLLRMDTGAIAAAPAVAADLVAVVLENHSSKVWSEIGALIRDTSTTAAGLRLLSVCAEEGICCAEEVWPLLRDVAEASPELFSEQRAAVDASSKPSTASTLSPQAQLQALCDILPTIQGKLFLELGLRLGGGPPLQSMKSADSAPSASPADQTSTPSRYMQPQTDSLAESPEHSPGSPVGHPLPPPQQMPAEVPAYSAPARRPATPSPVAECAAQSPTARRPVGPSSVAENDAQATNQRSEWDWDNRLAASPVLPKDSRYQGGANWDVLHVLSAASPSTWRERVKSLKAIDTVDSDGLHGQALLPHLVLQAEDDHPAVASAALQAISCVAMHLESIGDFLAERLAVAIRFRLREGHARFLDASAKCLVALIRHDALAASKLYGFLVQALGCSRDAALAAVAAVHEAGLSTPRDRGWKTPAPLDELLRAAVSPRRAARRKFSSIPAGGTPSKKSTSNSRPVSRNCTPQRSPATAMSGKASVSPIRSGSSPVQGSALAALRGNRSNHPPATLQLPTFAGNIAEPNWTPISDMWSMSEEVGAAASFTPTAPYMRTPPRYEQQQSLESPMVGAARIGTSTSVAGRDSQRQRMTSELMSSSWGISPLPPVPPGMRPHAMLRSEGEHHIRNLVVESTLLPRPELEPPAPSTPQVEPAADADVIIHINAGAAAELLPESSFAPPPRSVATRRSVATNSVTSLAGPRLYGDSQLLSPSASVGRDSLAPVVRRNACDDSSSVWQSPLAGELPSFPASSVPSASPSAITPQAFASHPNAGSPVVLDDTEDTAPSMNFRTWMRREDEFRTPVAGAHVDSKLARNLMSPGETSFLISPPNTSTARVKRLCASAAAGLHALEAGGDPTAWHESLRALASWRPGADGVRGEAAAEAVMELLLDAAPRLRDESLPEIWRALSELREAPWLSEAAVLELAVGQCLSFTVPSVVAAFLVARISDGRLSASVCLDGCLERLCQTDGSTGKTPTLLISLIQALLEELKPRDMLRELLLPNLPDVAQWTSQRRLAALPGLRACLELLLRYASPACISEDCWSQLLRLLGTESPSHQSSAAAAASTTSSTAADNNEPRSHTPASASNARPVEVSDSHREWIHSAGWGQGDAAELNALFARLHRLVGELQKAKGDEISAVLQLVMQALSRHQAATPLRGFLQRLLARQRSARKENVPPRVGQSPAKDSVGEFVENDYASVRELAHDEGLPGSFPHALLSQLKRLLGGPVSASTRRAGLDCLGALISACGPLLLRVILQQFGSSGILLQSAAVRGPAQVRARAILTQLVFLQDQSASISQDNGETMGGVPRWLRMTWRTLIASSAGTAARTLTTADPNQLAELLRWLSEDVLAVAGCALGAMECRELLAVVASALRDRSTTVRAMAARALHALARARGSEDIFRDDVHMAPLKPSVRADALSCLDAGPPPMAPTVRTPSVMQSPQISATAPERYAASPSDRGVGYVARSSSRDHPARSSTSCPRRLRFSPQVDRSPKPVERGPRGNGSVAKVLLSSNTPEKAKASPMDDMRATGLTVDKLSECTTRLSGASSVSSPAAPSSKAADTPSAMSPGCDPVKELEQLMTACIAELASGTDLASGVWRQHLDSIPSHLENICLGHPGLQVTPLVPTAMVLCSQLVSRGGEEMDLLEIAVIVARTAKICFEAQALQNLSSAGAVASFRATLQALVQLQKLSKSSDASMQRAAASLLLELPPVLARIIDHLEVPVQLVAWIRVAAEVLEEVGAGCATEGWALRFCARCVDRCASQLTSGGAEFPAWEVLSEVLRFHERHLENISSIDAAWAADCEMWRRALESSARAVSRQYPEQAREFLLLATCTGSTMPVALQRMLEEAKLGET